MIIAIAFPYYKEGLLLLETREHTVKKEGSSWKRGALFSYFRKG
jgi:hypothetical protein